jgi:hypothetical protein
MTYDKKLAEDICVCVCVCVCVYAWGTMGWDLFLTSLYTTICNPTPCHVADLLLHLAVCE